MILSVINTIYNRASYTTIPKLLGSAERDIEIARVREITLAEMTTTSSPTTCLRATLPLSNVAQLEAYLIDDVGVWLGYNYNIVL